MKYQFLYIQDALNVHVIVLHCAKFVLVVLADQIRQPLFHPKHKKKSIKLHFQPMFHFCTPWKHQKTSGFLFSGGTEVKHSLKIG